MDLQFFLVIGHILGVAFGVGGATASDVIFLRSVQEGEISRSAYGILRAVSLILWAGIALTVLSGAGFVSMYGWGMFQNPGFLAKMTAVLAVIINGIVFHFFVFPSIKRSVGLPVGESEITTKRNLFAISGAVSIVSWYSAFLLAFMRGVVEFPYWLFFVVYVGVIAIAAMAASLTLQRITKQ